MTKIKELDGGAIDPSVDQSLDSADRKILDIIQSAFPLESRPYRHIGEMTGLTEEEAFQRVQVMKERKIIRRIGANFDARKLEFRSTLCAAKVPAESIELFTTEVNALSGVTHNYLRDHEYNIWFTYIGPSWENVCDTLATLSAKTGVPIINLPATRVYKIRVNFDMAE